MTDIKPVGHITKNPSHVCDFFQKKITRTTKTCIFILYKFHSHLTVSFGKKKSQKTSRRASTADAIFSAIAKRTPFLTEFPIRNRSLHHYKRLHYNKTPNNRDKRKFGAGSLGPSDRPTSLNSHRLTVQRNRFSRFRIFGKMSPIWGQWQFRDVQLNELVRGGLDWGFLSRSI